MLSSIYRQHLFFIVLHPGVFVVNNIQWKPLNRASVYRANRLFEQFRLKKKRSYLFPHTNTSFIRAGTPLIGADRRVAALWLSRS